jgi:hypothetical protein
MKNILLILMVPATIFGCTPEKNGGVKMDLENREPISQHCVGRTFIDLPSSFQASTVTTGIFKASTFGAQEEPIDVIVRASKQAPNFVLVTQKRRAELDELASPTVDILQEVKALDSNATLFRVQRIDDAYVSELVFLRGSSVITARLHSFRKQYLAAEEKLVRLAAEIDAIDSEKGSAIRDGFCLGPVKIGGNFAVEKASFLFRNGRGAHFEVEVDTYAPDERVSLLARMSGPDSLLKIFNVNHMVHRAGERTVAGMRAQEWLGSAQTTDDADAKALQFTLETMRPAPSRVKPSLNLTFETAQPLEDGSQTKTLISNDEAVRLWDSVVASLRPATS